MMPPRGLRVADAARTMPHTVRRIGTDDETLAELTVLAGYDDDLAGQSTRLTRTYVILRL